MAAVYPAEDLTVLRIDTKESRENIIKFLGKIPSGILVLLDKSGKVNKLFGVWAHPTTFIVDRRGLVRYRAMGGAEWTGSEAREILDGLIREK